MEISPKHHKTSMAVSPHGSKVLWPSNLAPSPPKSKAQASISCRAESHKLCIWQALRATPKLIRSRFNCRLGRWVKRGVVVWCHWWLGQTSCKAEDVGAVCVRRLSWFLRANQSYPTISILRSIWEVPIYPDPINHCQDQNSSLSHPNLHHIS